MSLEVGVVGTPVLADVMLTEENMTEEDVTDTVHQEESLVLHRKEWEEIGTYWLWCLIQIICYMAFS